jgi:predicted ATP-grasp superfamily ATP-dependent carboligase
MRGIFIHEYLSGGGETDSEAEAAELLPMGLAMRDALLADLLRIPDLAVSCAVSARAGLPFAHPRLGAVAAQAGEPAVAFVQRRSRAHALCWVIAPESKGLLSAMHEAVGAPRWVGCDAASLRTASSKSATLRALGACGVPTPLERLPESTTRGGCRWIVKPDDGAGAVATRVHAWHADAQADLAQRRAVGLSATCEPFVEGEALSISMLAGPGFVQPLAFNEQQLAIDGDGQLHFIGVRPNAIDSRRDPRATRLHTLALDVKRALPGLRGFVGIDLVWHAERGPVVIEVNPRLTCAYVGLSVALGRNLAEEILLLHSLPGHADAEA